MTLALCLDRLSLATSKPNGIYSDLLVGLTPGRSRPRNKLVPMAWESKAATFRFAGRIAVVSGASSGIGRAIALRLVAEGANVTAVGRDKARLDELLAAGNSASGGADGGPGRIIPVQVDLTDDEARRAFVADLSAGPRVDLLIHSAGAYSRGDHVNAPIDA